MRMPSKKVASRRTFWAIRAPVVPPTKMFQSLRTTWLSETVVVAPA
jgi:hypothetical protein